MRLFISVSILALLAACGGGNAPAPDDETDTRTEDHNTRTDDRVNIPDRPEEPAREPIEVKDAWLRVEARGDSNSFEWYVGNEEPAGHDDLAEALRAYADKQDDEAALEGPDEDGISSNPVYFTSKAGVTTRAFAALIETMARTRIWRACVEMTAPGDIRKREWVELPVNQGLDDEPGPVMAHLHTTLDGETVRYHLGPDPRQHREVKAAALTPARVKGETFDRAAYRTTRDALKQAIAPIATPNGEWLERLEIATTFEGETSESQFPIWAVVFAAFEAARQAEFERNKGPLKITLKFSDALGNYSRD